MTHSENNHQHGAGQCYLPAKMNIRQGEGGALTDIQDLLYAKTF
jgi:hypothetical protein